MQGRTNCYAASTTRRISPTPPYRSASRRHSLTPPTATTQMWLGRAYGLKASQVNMLNAFTLAKKVHVAFERAIQLNPANVTAMDDLGQLLRRCPCDRGRRSGQGTGARPEADGSFPCKRTQTARHDRKEEQRHDYGRVRVQSRCSGIREDAGHMGRSRPLLPAAVAVR